MPLLMNASEEKRRKRLRRRSLSSLGHSKTSLNDDSSAEVSTTLKKLGESDRSLPVKRVVFAQEPPETAADLEQVEPLSEDECRQIWYQEDDYTRFEKDRILTSFIHRSSLKKDKLSEDDHSIRGLEPIVDDRLSKRQTGERKDLLKAMKSEEAHQKKAGKFPDANRFRAISLRHTKPARDRAIANGSEDAKLIQGKPKSWISRKLPFGSTERPTRRRSMF
eukprot:scaffold2844_cov123-Cylindrotheca_fusiformis.AAC.4